MSQFSTVYDAFVDLVEAAIDTDYRRIPNPYVPESTNKIYLRRAWGLLVGPGVRVNEEIGCNLVTYERIFQVVMVRQITTTHHDLGQREALEKELMEEIIKLAHALEENPTLGGVCVKIDNNGDSGIEFFSVADLRYYSCSIDILTKYKEVLT